MTRNQSLPRRWFRYSLRTMFVVVTVVALWLGWELKFIRDRRSFLVAMDELRTAELQTSKSPVYSGTYVTHVVLDASIPLWRCWLGDEPQAILVLPRTSSDSDRETAQRLFPEAEVHRRD